MRLANSASAPLHVNAASSQAVARKLTEGVGLA